MIRAEARDLVFRAWVALMGVLFGVLLSDRALAQAAQARSASVLAPLVPEGEPEGLLGAATTDGRMSFTNAPLRASSCEAVAWSPDGKFVASGTRAGMVRLWDAATGRELKRLEHSIGALGVLSVAWSPDGRRIASGGGDGTVRLWDVATGRELQRLEGHSALVNSVAWSADGKAVASGGTDNTIRLWDVATGHEIRRLEGHSDEVFSVAWSPDGKSVASGSRDRTVRLWDGATGRELRRLEGHSVSVSSVGWSPDGKSLASGGEDKTIRLWDAATGREIRRLEGHTFSVNSVAWSPDGKSLASGSGELFYLGSDSTVRVWDVATGRELRRLEGHSASVLSVAWSPDGKSIASGGADKSVRLWDVATGRELRRLEGHSESVLSAAWSPDGKRVASGGLDKTVHLWDAITGRELRRLEGYSESVLSVAWSPNGKSVASGNGDNTVWLWDVTTEHDVRRLQGHTESVSSVAWSRDGNFVASGSGDKTIRLWDATTGREFRRLEGHSETVLSVAWSPDGKRVASSSLDKTVRIWDAATGRELRRLKAPQANSVNSVAWSPDGKWIAAGSWDKIIRLWDAATGREVRRLVGHTDEVYSVGWSPDGRSIVSATEKGSVRLWDAATGREVRRLEGHSGTVFSVAWSPDGKSVISGGEDGTLRVWRTEALQVPLELEAWACGDSWISWRGSLPSEHRILRAENGSLLPRLMSDGALSPQAPEVGERPRLTAHASVSRPATAGALGEVIVTVSNAPDATPAVWLELEADTPPSNDPLVFRFPSTALRLEPGANVQLHLEYGRRELANPQPRKRNVTLRIRHAHDEGKALEVPVELSFQSAQLVINTKEFSRNGDDLAVPIVLTNIGDAATGRLLHVVASFEAPNQPAVPSNTGTVLNLGLEPQKSYEFSLRVPPSVQKASEFRIALSVNEGFAPGVAAESPFTGFPSTWTLESQVLRARTPLVVYALFGLAVAVVVGLVLARIYLDPTVVSVGRDASALVRLPFDKLPHASRALSRAGRLAGVLGNLHIPDQRWQRLVGLAEHREEVVEQFAEVLGAELGGAVADGGGIQAELRGLRLRFGPQVVIAAVETARIESGQAQRLTDVWRSTGAATVIIFDFTQAGNARSVFESVARFNGVVLSPDALRDVMLTDEPLRVFEQQVASQRPLRELSPYRTAGGVEDEAMFVGREEERRKLADRDLQNAVLVGARQMGKSSLLKAVARRLATRPDIEVYYHALASDDLIGELAQELKQPKPESIAEFQNLTRGSKEKPRVWLIDEADGFVGADLARTSPRPAPVSWALRALAEEGTTYFVLAGFWDLFHAAVFDTHSPLRNLGELVRLGPLEPRAASKLVVDPMCSLGITVDEAAVSSILAETGCRANLIVLACQGLLERLTPEQKTIATAEVDAVWNSQRSLRDAVMYWKERPLDRAVGHAALSLDRPTSVAIEERLRAAGIDISATELERTLERLELSYVLARQPDPSGPDRFMCPVPLIVRLEARIMSWDEHLERDADELRVARGRAAT